MLPWVGTVEFYVVCTVAAAAVVALCIRPSRCAAAITHTVSGWLCSGADNDGEEAMAPRLYIECLEDGNVLIRRTGAQEVGDTGALSLAVVQTGFSLEIKERLTRGCSVGDEHVTEVVFILKFLAPEWYHVRYTAEPAERFAAFTLHVRPGLKMTVPLNM